MWKLVMRGERGTPLVDVGSYASIGDAAEVILNTEGNPLGALFFRVYVDPPMGASDAEVLSRLEYQSPKRFYLLTREAH
jgi:hypothetical protein